MCEDAAVKEPGRSNRQAVARDRAMLNYELLCDVGTLLALPCIMPMLESLNLLMQFAQSTHAFVSVSVAAVKIAQVELYIMYCDSDSSFQPMHFQQLCDVVSDYSYTISQEWVVDLIDGSEALRFRIGSHSYVAHKLCSTSGATQTVNKSDLEEVVSSVKGQCRDAAEMLIEFIKLSQIAITAVLGGVEDERTFSTLAYMKSKVRNRLISHLDTCVKFFAQPWWNQESFPYAAAITDWGDARKRMGDKYGDEG